MKKLILLFALSLGLLTVHAQKPNNFIGNIDFEINSSNKTVGMKISNNEWQTAATINVSAKDNVRMIFDLKKENVTILTDAGKGEKVGIVSKLKDLPIPEVAVENLDVKIEKTKETKEILGYPCTKYIITTKDGVAECWITEKIHFNPFESFDRLGGSGKQLINGDAYKNLKGLALESKYVDTKNQTTTVKVTSIDKTQPSDAVFSTEGYEIMDMSGFPGLMDMGK